MAQPIQDYLKALGFRAGKELFYNYGIWKPKKQKFRFIAGTRPPPPPEGGGREAGRSAPGPTYFLCKELVSVLKVLIRSLKELDEIRQRPGLRCFWGIDSVGEFTRMVRARVHR